MTHYALSLKQRTKICHLSNRKQIVEILYTHQHHQRGRIWKPLWLVLSNYFNIVREHSSSCFRVQSRPSEQQTPERFDISISRPPTRTTSKQDNPGYPPRQGASASDPKGASQPYAATFTETPTSGLTKVDLSTEVARSNSNDRQHATMVPISDSVQRLDVRVSPLQSRQPNLDSPNTRERTVKPDLGSKGEVAIPSASHRPQSKLDSPRDTQKNITTPNISRSTLPVVSDNARLLKAFNQESPRLQVDHSPRLENIQSSRILDSPLVQSAQSTSQQDTPPQFGLTYGQVAPHIPDHPSAPEVIIGSSSSTPYALSSVPQITPRRSTVTMTPKQGEDIKSYSPSSRLNPAQDPQLLSKWPGNSAANAALGRGETETILQSYIARAYICNCRSANSENAER